MYGTKRFHSTAGHDYLAVGDSYIDRREVLDDRYKNKQMLTSVTKTGQTAGYFSIYKHSSDVYNDSNKYINTQPLDDRKNGFGSSDAKKRDEFTLNIKALQYKELLSHETKAEKIWDYKNKIINYNNDSLNEFITNNTQQFNDAHKENTQSLDINKHYQYSVPNTTYDIGRAYTTPTCFKCGRDKFYCPHRIQVNESDNNTGRHIGNYKTTTQQMNELIKTVNIKVPKTNGAGNHRSIAAFYDSTHLSTTQRL